MKNLGLVGFLIVIALFFWLVSDPDSFRTVFAAGGEALGRLIVGFLRMVANALPDSPTPIPTPSGSAH